jgi:hypothetical protein
VEVLEDRILLSAYVVTTTADTGPGSLRNAITQVNADTNHVLYPSPGNPSVDEIDFDITAASDTGGGFNAATGVATITPQSGLPYVTNSVLLDGYTQPGATVNTLSQGDNAVLKIQLDLSGALALNHGLHVAASNSTVRGLVVNDLKANGTVAIYIAGTADKVVGNFLGTDVTGTSVVGNGTGTTGVGYDVVGGTVGGTTPDTRNLIAGFATGVSAAYVPPGGAVVEGNYIGTDATGTKALANQVGVFGATVGGTAPGAGNLVSGNQTGIAFATLVQGNLVGTDPTGTIAVANGTGIRLGDNSLVGGTTPAARNIISGNGLGVFAAGAPNALIEGNYIGTDVAGTKAVAGDGDGIWLWPGDNGTVGGTAPGAGNVISGNGIGIRGFGNNNTIAGNLIGTDYTGTKAVGNSTGIDFQDGGNNNIIGGLDTNVPGQPLAGGGNLISGNYYGITISGGSGASGNVVEGNYIGTDLTGTKAIGRGGVGLGVGATNNTIGGTTAAARNIILGGVGIGPGGNSGTLPSNNVVEGNYLGTDATGSYALGGSGVEIDAGNNNVITGNVIDACGNRAGVGFEGFGNPSLSNTGNVVQGNYIGTDASGRHTIDPNGHSFGGGYGVEVNGGSGTGTAGNLIGGTALGQGNVIAGSISDGVLVFVSTGNAILGNSIHDNGGQGIHLFNGGNNNQAAPVLTSASSSSSSTTISGTLQSVAGTMFRIEFFANTTADPSGYGQGRTYLGFTTVTTNSSGTGSFTVTLTTPLPAGQTVLSATATNQTTNDTSGFARDVSIPVVSAITAPLAPVAVNTAVNVSASFTDGIPSTTHTAVWNWGDSTTSTGTVTDSSGSGTVTGSHSYTTDGVYTVTLTVTNNGGGSAQSVFQYVVVYNPEAGFVTGGGNITSPAGAYAANPSLTGQANFGLNAKYKSGATVPTGNTDFEFPAANLTFQSTSYDWLVITTTQAQYQGSGTINGAGNYGFLVTALDGGGHGADRFRLQIWDNNNHNAVVYDTQPGAANTAAPTTALGGGRIQVHTNAQLVAGGANSGGADVAPLTAEELQPVMQEAIARWAAAGIDAAQVAALSQVTVGIGKFPGPWLGMAFPGAVWIDQTAAGYGWYLDPSPAGDGAFPAAPGSPAYGRVDLLTVVEHELGHELGLADTTGDGLMGVFLPTGVRRVPAPRAGTGQLVPSPGGPLSTQGNPQALAVLSGLPAASAFGTGTSSIPVGADPLPGPAPFAFPPALLLTNRDASGLAWWTGVPQHARDRAFADASFGLLDQAFGENPADLPQVS